MGKKLKLSYNKENERARDFVLTDDGEDIILKDEEDVVEYLLDNHREIAENVGENNSMITLNVSPATINDIKDLMTGKLTREKFDFAFINEDDPTV